MRFRPGLGVNELKKKKRKKKSGDVVFTPVSGRHIKRVCVHSSTRPTGALSSMSLCETRSALIRQLFGESF